MASVIWGWLGGSAIVSSTLRTDGSSSLQIVYEVCKIKRYDWHQTLTTRSEEADSQEVHARAGEASQRNVLPHGELTERLSTTRQAMGVEGRKSELAYAVHIAEAVEVEAAARDGIKGEWGVLWGAHRVG